MSQDVEDKVVSVGGVKFKKPKVKEVTENGIRYKVFYEETEKKTNVL